MDFLKNLAHEGNQKKDQEGHSAEGGGIMGKLNSALGGGQSGEKKEDALDKAVDLFQEHVLKAGPQNNESALEQAKDEQISDAIRSGFKSVTGRDFPVADK
ncbi:hypothetical protein BDZ94DRAFT_1264640 [Collybia nuda]|uniref:Uncharacterized protein n=1 Tax=Collybia nuda TaxID=64659 RepID=A0A9P5Y2C5_9AGAR|nr:hypothetical protein BDZ94DRAFT_1264640 [Collybia nuda]